MSESWYCRAFGQELGPMSFADLAVLVERKDVLPADLIKCGGDGPWAPAEAMPGLFAAGAKAPSSLFQTNSDSGANSEESKPANEHLAVPPKAPETATSPLRHRRLSRIAAATAALVLLGASAGGLTGWLVPAGATSPAMANGSAIVDQQRIEALRRQIRELQSERERLAQAAQALAPNSSAADPAAAEAPINR